MNLTGTHRIPLTTKAAAIIAALDHAGWRVVVLDGRRGTVKERLLLEFGRVLDAPEWFGQNWDALVDLLRTRSAAEPHGLAVVIDHAESLFDSAPVLVDIVNELAAEGAPIGLHLRSRPAFFRSAP